MFVTRVVVLAIACIGVSAFSPARVVSKARAEVTMSAEKPSISKVFGAAMLAASMFSMPVLAKEGAEAKLSFFGDEAFSSPFTVNEKREDAIYSPYSPYGNGAAASYNSRKGGAEEIAFWKTKLDTAIKRTENVPKFAAKKQWSDVQTELTSYSYNLREALLRVAETSKSPKDATAAAKRYFSDLNDIFTFSRAKNGDAVLAAYKSSLKNLADFKSYL